MLNLLKEMAAILNDELPYLYFSLCSERGSDGNEIDCINVFFRRDVEQPGEWIQNLARIVIDESVEDPTLYITVSRYNDMIDMESLMDVNIGDLPGLGVESIKFIKSHDVERHQYTFAGETVSIELANPGMYSFVVDNIRKMIPFFDDWRSKTGEEKNQWIREVLFGGEGEVCDYSGTLSGDYKVLEYVTQASPTPTWVSYFWPALSRIFSGRQEEISGMQYTVDNIQALKNLRPGDFSRAAYSAWHYTNGSAANHR